MKNRKSFREQLKLTKKLLGVANSKEEFEELEREKESLLIIIASNRSVEKSERRGK